MRDQGRLIEWFDEQGYGFIQPNDQQKERVFLHIKDFAQRGPRPIVGCALDYLVIVDGKGRFRATQVVYLKAHQTAHSNRSKNIKPSSHRTIKMGVMPILIVLYVLLLVGSCLSGKIPDFYLALFLVINALTYVLYLKDKKAAQQNQWRVQEQSLHLFSFLGGWPSAWFAQQQLRHKTQKQPFKQIYICTIILNIGLTLWFIFN